MPEGPEVRRCGEQLDSIIGGEKIVAIEAISGKIARKGIPGIELFEPGKLALQALVKGKVIFVNLWGDYQGVSDSVTLVSTLGMSGWWYPPSEQLTEEWKLKPVYYNGTTVTAGEIVAKAEKHARVRLVTESGKIAQYVDMRNFGNLSLLPVAKATERWHALGIDAFDVLEQRNPVISRVTGDHRRLGEILMSQEIVAGIGNIYRAEILYLAKLNPWRTGRSLTYYEADKLVQAIAAVTDVAYETHGTMRYPLPWLQEHGLADLGLDAELERGGVKQVGHLVYGRSHDLFANETKHVELAGRTMWWVPKIQGEAP